MVAGERLSRYINEVGFGGAALLPVEIAGGVLKAHDLAHGLGQHGRVVLLADDEVVEAILFKQCWSDVVVAETAAALPLNGIGDAAFVFTVNDLLHARNDVCMAMLAQLNHDPAAAHLVGNCA